MEKQKTVSLYEESIIPKKIYIILIICYVTLFHSCDPGGNLNLTSWYEYDIIVYKEYLYHNNIIKETDNYYPGMSFSPAAMGHTQYNHIIAIRIETTDGIILAEYLPEYLDQLRKIYGIKPNQYESWVFTEKGLFLRANEISRRFNFDSEKILEYYRSDEAVQDLQAMLDQFTF